MRISRADRAGTGRLGLMLMLLAAGCASEPQKATAPGSRARQQLEAAIADPLDFGQDWDAGGAASLGDPLAGEGAGVEDPSGPVWGIVLRTFTAANHQQAAATMIRELPRISPELGSSWTHEMASGSVVAYGRYAGPDDEAAQRDLQWIKEIEMNGQRVFPRAMLSRIKRGSAEASSPYQLMSVRRRYPNIDPLYTLQVALWGTFGGAMSWQQAREKAESDVQRLRGEGVPAYVHHDANAEFSMVTVGLFDRRALNPRSGLFSDEVEVLLGRFQHHLVNGQPVTNPQTGASQQPNLVLVPRQ